MSDDYISKKFRAKFKHNASVSGVVGSEQFSVPGENKVRVQSTFLGAGTLAVQAKIFNTSTWVNIGEVNSAEPNKTFDISTYDLIRFNFITPPDSAGEVAASGFFSGAGASGFATASTDSGSIDSTNITDLAIKGGTDINVAVVGNEIIITSTASAGAGLSAYTHDFLTGDWVLSASEYLLTVPATTHGLGTEVDVFVYEYNGVIYTEVGTEVIVALNGDLTIKVSSSPDNRFNGRLHIKES